MATSVTKFEVLLPTDNASEPSVNTFLDTIGAISPFVQSQADVYTSSSGAPVQYSSIYGLLTSSQTSSALSALNTLNSSLASVGNPAVVCISYTVTTEP